MANLSLQDAVIRLCSDARLRGAAGEATWAELGVAGDALLALKELNTDDLEFYSRGLAEKRWAEVARAVAWTFKVWPEMREIYVRWLLISPAPTSASFLPPGLVEAERARSEWELRLAASELAPAYTRYLLRFELMSRASRHDLEERTLETRYRVHELVRDLKADRVPFDVSAAPTFYELGKEMRWRAL